MKQKPANVFLPVPSTSSLQRYVQPERKLGVLLLGLGKYSHDQLAPALGQSQFCALVGVVTDDPDHARQWQQRYDLPRQNCYDYQTFGSCRNNPNIDLVYVVTPNATHAEFVLQAAEAGKHVLCEKPLGISVRDCEIMIEACRNAEVQLAVGYRLHFDPVHREVARLGREQVFGPVKYLEASQGYRVDGADTARLDRHLSGGGPLLDVGIYAVQAARYVLGEEPISVTAQRANTDPEKFREGLEETVLWQLRFPGGAIANCATTYANTVGRLHVVAENGWFGAEHPFGYETPRGYTHEGPLEIPGVFAAQLLLDEVAQCIFQGLPNPVSGEEGLNDLRVIEAIYKAAESGREVVIK